MELWVPPLDELLALSSVEMRRRIGTKEISPVELVEASIARIEALDPTVNAIAARNFARARKLAVSAESAARKGEQLGALHGLPTGIKDLHETAGLLTTYGSPLYRDHVPAHDAAMVALVRKGGAIILCKTNVPEFGAGHGIPAVRLIAGFNAPDSNLCLVLTAADTRDKVRKAEQARAKIDSIADQAAVIDMFPISVDGGKPRRGGERCNSSALAEQHRGLKYDHHVDRVLGQRSKRAVEVIGAVGIGNDDRHSQFPPCRLQLLQLRRCFRVAQVGQNSDSGGGRHDLSRKLHLLGRQSLHVRGNPGHIASRPRHARDQS